MLAMMQEQQNALFGALYAEDFDAPPIQVAPEKPPEPPPPPEITVPVFTVADMESAHAAGRAAARAELASSQAAARIKMLSQIAGAIEESQAACRAAAEEAADAIARTMLSALAACLPALCARHGETELRALIHALLPSLIRQKRIIVQVNPAMIAPMTEEISALDPAIAECVVLLPADQIPPGDVRVAWQDGAAVRDARQVHAEIVDALATLGLLEQERPDV
jgi:hypothetical protein